MKKAKAKYKERSPVKTEAELKAEAEAKLEAKRREEHLALERAKTRRDAGEYEPLKGEWIHGVFLERSAHDISSVGAVLRIVYLDGPDGKLVPPYFEHLIIPNVKPSNGILRRSVR